MAKIHLIEDSEIGSGIYDLAIYQGKTFGLSLSYAGDLTSGTFQGQVRDKYRENDGVLLGSFDFSATYDPLDGLTGKTAIQVSLPYNVTVSMASTIYQGSKDGLLTPSIKNCYVYDIEYTSLGVVILIAKGFVQVVPEVTD